MGDVVGPGHLVAVAAQVVGGASDGAADGPEEARVVYVAVPARPATGPSPPLALAAMGATSTVRLAFDGLRVPEADVICELGLDRWRERDRMSTAQPHPAPFGLTATCVRLLAEADPDVAAGLGAQLDELRRRSYTRAHARADARADANSATPGDLDALVGLRADALLLANRSAAALVASRGGRGLGLDDPAQRLAREATFYTVQAQSPELRRALLNRLARPPG